ncbi:MAG: hypothetical protein RMJ31_05010 [Nitrososphaerota archaeon]|nr:hypothetical protein [Nitrososphaerales archaeon]MDW8045116.1 hypothetical protein [Nitrososphaerota archaeon]
MNIIPVAVDYKFLFILTTIAIPALGILILIGLIYPILKGVDRSYKKPDSKIVTDIDKDTEPQIINPIVAVRSLYESGRYREGILLAYRSVRNHIANMLQVDTDKSLTEREVILQILDKSPKSTFDTNLIKELYELYEVARFSNREVSEGELYKCIQILTSIYEEPSIKGMLKDGVK